MKRLVELALKIRGLIEIEFCGRVTYNKETFIRVSGEDIKRMHKEKEESKNV